MFIKNIIQMLNKITFFSLISVILIKVLAIIYTDFDLFGDEAQYWVWSQALDFGYYSKSPLLSWVIFAFTKLFGNSFESLKAIPLILYIFSSYIVFLLVLKLYKNKKLATYCAVSFYLLPAVTVSSFLISTDILLIIFVSLSLIILLKIRENPRYLNFVLLGIFLGLSFLAKYAAVYFFISTIILIIFDKKIKNVIYKNFSGIILFFITFFLILMPNIIWNSKNNWLTLSHTSENVGLEKTGLHFFQGVEFLLSQGVMLGPLLFFSFFIFIKKIVFNFQTKFLLIFSLPVFVIILIESLLVRANANWAAFGIIPIYILLFNHLYFYAKKILIINNIINFVFCVIFFGIIIFSIPMKAFDRINGISSFTNYFQDGTFEKKQFIVIQDRLLYSSLKYGLRKTNNKIFTPHNPAHEIKSHFQLTDALPGQFNKNFIYVGDVSKLKYLKNKFNIQKIKDVDVLFKKKPLEVYEISF